MASQEISAKVLEHSTAWVSVVWRNVVKQTTLALGLTQAGFSAFVQTLIGAADAATFRTLIGALSSASLTGKNAIINGDFTVWQRQTSFTSIASSAYCADRWIFGKTSSAVYDAARSTDVPTVAQAGRLVPYSLLLTVTTADAAVAVGDTIGIGQYIEGYNFAALLAQRQFTCSFWVKSSKAGTYCVSFRSDTGSRSWVAEYTVSAINTWEFKTVTVSASPSAGTWDYTTGIGLNVLFTLMSGATFQTTAGAWQSVNAIGTSNQVNHADTNGATFRIAGVQIEPGAVASAFETKHWLEDLRLCQRYYCKSYADGVYPGDTTLTNSVAVLLNSGGAAKLNVEYPVPMRATPTFTQWAPTSGTTSRWYNVTSSADVAMTATNNGSQRVSLLYGNVAAANCELAGHYTANAEL